MSLLKRRRRQGLVEISARGRPDLDLKQFPFLKRRVAPVAVPLSEVTPGKQLDLPLLAATLAPWPRKHGAPSLQVTFEMVYADNVRSA